MSGRSRSLIRSLTPGESASTSTYIVTVVFYGVVFGRDLFRDGNRFLDLELLGSSDGEITFEWIFQ